MDNKLIPLVNLVEQKRGGNKEFFINFFERCNLSCSFCWQDHSDWTGIDQIREKAETVIQQTRAGIHYDINVMGGELFMDELPQSVFADYLAFCERIHATVEDYQINFVTNLVFLQVERVLDFVRLLDSKGIRFSLCTSYDPSGRFNVETLKIFESNLPHFKLWLSNVSVVLTKPNIAHFQRGTADPVFDRLYADYPVFFDYYSPEKNYKALQPTDEALVDFFLWLNDHYPLAEPIRSFRERSSNTATCRSSFILLPSGRTGSCRILADTSQFHSDPKVVDNIHESEARFIEHFDCLSCEYFQRCGLGCFLHSDHVSITTKTCQFKRLFKEIT